MARAGALRRDTSGLALGSIVSGLLAYVVFALVTHGLGAHAAAPVATVNPDVPAAVERVIARALAKPPGERFATMRDLAAALPPRPA